MRTKRRISAVVFLGCALAAMSTPAVVNIGPDVIVRGTDIEVVGPGPDLQAIIDGITGAGTLNPYSIKLGPGEYTLTPPSGDPGLQMKANVSIIGSGQGVTVLTGAVGTGAQDATSAIVSGATGATLTDLSVVNTGLGSVSIGIFPGGSQRIERVAATASGGTTFNYGVYDQNASPTMAHVTAKASGTSANTGVLITGASNATLTHVSAIGEGGSGTSGISIISTASPTLTHVTATGSGATGANAGVVFSSTSAPTLTHVTATGQGGTTAYGVLNQLSSTPTLTHVIATGKDGTTSNYGVFSNGSNVVLTVDASVFTGTTAALSFGGNTGTRIANSHVNGPVLNNPGGTVQCGGVYDAALALVGC